MHNTLHKLLTVFVFVMIPFAAQSQQTPQDILNKANEYYLKGEFQDAIKFYDDYLDSYPQNIEVLNFRGLCYLNLKDYSRAISDFSSSLGVKRTASMTYVYRATAYLGQNNFASAKKDYEDALMYDVANTEAYYGLNFLFVESRQFEKSIFTLEKVIALDPKAARGYFMKALTCSMMNDTAKIFENVSQGLYWDSTYFLKYTKSDLVFVKADRFKYALDLFSDEVRANPQSYLAYFKRGLIEYMMGSFDKAEADLKKSLSLNKAPKEDFTAAANKLIRACYRVD